jgi:hypothetical protein
MQPSEKIKVSVALAFLLRAVVRFRFGFALRHGFAGPSDHPIRPRSGRFRRHIGLDLLGEFTQSPA